MATKDQHLSDAALIMHLMMSPPATEPGDKYERESEHLTNCNSCLERLEELRRTAPVLGTAIAWDQNAISTSPRLDWLLV